jgi:hypothetical protein
MRQYQVETLNLRGVGEFSWGSLNSPRPRLGPRCTSYTNLLGKILRQNDSLSIAIDSSRMFRLRYRQGIDWSRIVAKPAEQSPEHHNVEPLRSTPAIVTLPNAARESISAPLPGSCQSSFGSLLSNSTCLSDSARILHVMPSLHGDR